MVNNSTNIKQGEEPNLKTRWRTKPQINRHKKKPTTYGVEILSLI
jgi:hypothetical protein